MLHEAGRLTIQIALDLLPEGIGLKDGTPYNVLFQGPNPVFIDVLSFERRDQHDPMWLPYAQFVRTFLLPLLANKHYGIQLSEIFTTRRDGLEHEDVYRWTGPLQRLSLIFLSLVAMPTWLASRKDPDDQKIYQGKKMQNPEQAQVRAGVDAPRPSARSSTNWFLAQDSRRNGRTTRYRIITILRTSPPSKNDSFTKH